MFWINTNLEDEVFHFEMDVTSFKLWYRITLRHTAMEKDKRDKKIG